MFRHSPAVAALLLMALCPAALQANASGAMSPIYIDNAVFFANASNIVKVSFPVLQAGLQHPNLTDSATVDGFDWTRPFPGEVISGHEAHLRVAYDVPIPEDVVENSTTAVTSLTFSIPDSMMQSDKNIPKAMDPSWYICRHFFIGTKPAGPLDSNCDFLGQQCISDVKSSLTESWMNVSSEWPCSGLTFDHIPKSCWDTFGYARAEVEVFDSVILSDPVQARVETVDEQGLHDWRIGTGYGERGNISAYEAAANRTYLVVDVWGYGYSADKGIRQTPKASLTCLRPKQVKPGSSSTTTAAASATHPSTTPTKNNAIKGTHWTSISGLVPSIPLMLMAL